jgi:hypothetical protein
VSGVHASLLSEARSAMLGPWLRLPLGSKPDMRAGWPASRCPRPPPQGSLHVSTSRCRHGPSRSPPEPDLAILEDVLRVSNGNVAATARLLNVHRTQLYGWLIRRRIPLPISTRRADGRD